ncbi:hypothetical protein EYF80_035100 [Liparis tanakae]|uniref:Uncharacterized protein n=1 Tax=Liparis tanakae TaxID=230148 RepID=A0A4Z2GMA8_9TELE|nr:hypothetical protein EYF80_035100 [Liparis tanakae]
MTPAVLTQIVESRLSSGHLFQLKAVLKPVNRCLHLGTLRCDYEMQINNESPCSLLSLQRRHHR